VNERDQILAESGSRADAAKRSQAIREIFRATERDVEILKRMQQKKAQKYEGKEEVKEETQARLEREKEIVTLAQQNLDKAKEYERYGKAGNPNKEILQGSDGEEGDDGKVLIGEIPDLDDVDFQDMRAKDKQIVRQSKHQPNQSINQTNQPINQPNQPTFLHITRYYSLHHQ